MDVSSIKKSWLTEGTVAKPKASFNDVAKAASGVGADRLRSKREALSPEERGVIPKYQCGLSDET